MTDILLYALAIASGAFLVLGILWRTTPHQVWPAWLRPVAANAWKAIALLVGFALGVWFRDRNTSSDGGKSKLPEHQASEHVNPSDERARPDEIREDIARDVDRDRGRPVDDRVDTLERRAERKRGERAPEPRTDDGELLDPFAERDGESPDQP